MSSSLKKSQRIKQGNFGQSPKTPTPDFVPPALATLVQDFPTTGKWSYEIKFDGYRLLAIIKKHQPSLKTRHNQDWSKKFNSIIQALKVFPIKNAILDGELVALDIDGISRFQLLQNAMQARTNTKLVYYLFDILYSDGHDLTNLPLWKRRNILKTYFTKTALKTDLIQYSSDLDGDIQQTFKKLCKEGYEGVIAKNQDSTYKSTRTQDWLKIKCSHQQEFVIGGYTDPGGSREWFGAILIGYFDKNKRLIYCGKVGTGFNRLTSKKVFSYFKKHQQSKCPFTEIPRWKNAHWLKPILVAEIKFEEWTKIGYLRQPVFQGLRFDKPAIEVTKDN